MKNWSVINPEVDEVLSQGPSWLYDLLAALAITLGVVFAFFGLKVVRLQSTFYGAFICGALSSFILYLVPGQESGGVWLGVTIPFSLIGGYIIGRIIVLRKATLFIALGTSIAGVFNQYFVSYLAEVPDWLIYSIMTVSLIVSAIMIWRFFHISAILASAFLGGFIVLLGSARLLREQVSLIGMWVDPQFLQSCGTFRCWLPLLIGGCVFCLGSLFQLCRRRFNREVKTLDEDVDESDPQPTTPMVSPERNERPNSSRLSTPSRGGKKISPSAYGLNPFAHDHGNDPLIIELTASMENRRRRRNDDVDGIGTA